MATSFARPTINRAVHLRISPRPINIHELREVMHLLHTEFGEIEYFRSFKHDHVPAPESAVAIFKDDAAAEQCMQQSPIRFRLGRRPLPDSTPDHLPLAAREDQKLITTTANRLRQQAAAAAAQARVPSNLPRGPIGGGGWGMAPPSSRSLHTVSYTPYSDSDNDLSFEPSPASQRIYQILAQPSIRNFRDQIDMGHFHGSYQLEGSMPGMRDLMRRVPLKGLCCVDWRATQRQWLTMGKEREMEATGGPVPDEHIEEGQDEDKRLVRRRRQSLMELWEEGNAAAKLQEKGRG